MAWKLEEKDMARRRSLTEGVEMGFNSASFLYEAGFGLKQFSSRSGVIGITQPRRVAVLATANRVAHELRVSLSQDVGFQVRYDKKIGENSWDLLHDIQNDFLLRA